MICEDHTLLKSYKGGPWKIFTGLGPREEYKAFFVGYLGCYVCDVLYVLILLLISVRPIMISAFQKSTF